ncbi:C40 family peptidase [Acrocarpospora catenulata]|uniref:C40 family peptidase n=1 Tax=Acrocarpospora catenulata TaxID=2836182 RepID=UPI001BDB2F71|nr:C40 family peptidase [Acrocarpospora catenulata]
MVTATVCVLVLSGASPADADPSPTPADIRAAKEKVKERSRELNRAQLRLANAKARLHELTAQAERRVEAYNGELVRLRAAENRHRTLSTSLDGARDEVEQVREQVGAMAAEQYSQSGLTVPMLTLLGAGSTFLRRASLVSQLGNEKSAAMRSLRASQRVYTILRDQAARALLQRRASAALAEHLKRQAAEAVAAQVRETKEIKAEQTELTGKLAAAKSRVERLRAERLRREQENQTVPGWARAASAGLGGVAARWALTQLGKPYVWAADGPRSYDCSGLTMRAWQRAGVGLDHWTGTQWTSGPHVPLNRLRPGDLLFFGRRTADPGTIHHVGIFIGRGRMVHAPQTGDVVRIASMWRHDLVGATRPA